MKKIFFIIIASINLLSASSHAAKLEDFLEKKELPKKIGELIANQDISFGLDLASVELLDGINLSTKYNYDVEASYINKLYTRVDKWDLNSGIDVGGILKDSIDLPFSFSVNRNSSFFFVRQFQQKNDAIKALPYTPKRLPLNAKLALENLNTGDFVSMPANLSVAVGLEAATTMISPLVVDAKAGIYYVLNGEFTIQVFKLDSTHVRLKLITKRGKHLSSRAAVGVSFNVFGISLLDHQVDRLFERDLAEYGYTYSPGAQFIIDYIFDLSDKDASVAYNQILSSTFKFKDILVARTGDASELKDKIISSYEKADAIFEADKNNDPKNRRVQRIFKGFNNYKGHTRHLNFSFFVTAYSKDRTYTESKVTFVDKNEKNLDFFYPTYSKYIENHLGKWFFELKDQSYQNNFGLLPKFNLEDSKTNNPDLGLTFERKDKFFSSFEQRSVERFMISEIPTVIAKDIDFSQWRDGTRKIDSRIFFQLVLKSQGFSYLKNIPLEVLKKKLFLYVEEKQMTHVLDHEGEVTSFDKLEDFLLINRFMRNKKLNNLAESLTIILNNSNSEEMLRKLIELNEHGIFDKVGIGFLISLLPQDKLTDLVYLKLDMIGKNLKPILVEIGTLNFRTIYNELNQLQSRFSNRSFDLRFTDEDQKVQDIDILTQGIQ